MPTVTDLLELFQPLKYAIDKKLSVMALCYSVHRTWAKRERHERSIPIHVCRSATRPGPAWAGARTAKRRRSGRRGRERRDCHFCDTIRADCHRRCARVPRAARAGARGALRAVRRAHERQTALLLHPAAAGAARSGARHYHQAPGGKRAGNKLVYIVHSDATHSTLE